jgi:hypothetical protein
LSKHFLDDKQVAAEVGLRRAKAGFLPARIPSVL